MRPLRQAWRAVRILLVSQMYPGPDDPDLGAFVAQLEGALEARGHELERAVLDTRAGGKRRYLTLARRARRASRRFRPDVVYAHFLVPAGLIATLVSRAPLVVTAHGRDVRNVGELPGIRLLTRFTVRRASTVIAVSEYLRRELETRVPEARSKTEVIATRVGGPPEFVPPEAGVLVDPLDVDEIARGLETAAGLPCPNLVARAAAERHDLAEQARRVERVLERAARVG